MRLFLRNVNKASSLVRTFTWKVDAFTQPSRTATPRYMISALYELKNDSRKHLLAQAIVFIATELLDNLEKILPKNAITAPYQRHVIRFPRFSFRREHLQGDELESWRLARTKIHTEAYWKRAKRKISMVFSKFESNPAKLRSRKEPLRYTRQTKLHVVYCRRILFVSLKELRNCCDGRAWSCMV